MVASFALLFGLAFVVLALIDPLAKKNKTQDYCKVICNSIQDIKGFYCPKGCSSGDSEHVHRVCLNCGGDWVVVPMDAWKKVEQIGV